ncbi:hypothetical protein [Candidatus Enterovibrio altilux]
MRHHEILLATPDNVMKPFVLNERFHSFYKEKDQFFSNEIIV